LTRQGPCDRRVAVRCSLSELGFAAPAPDSVIAGGPCTAWIFVEDGESPLALGY
jgi:hypothetical protein